MLLFPWGANGASVYLIINVLVGLAPELLEIDASEMQL